MTKVEKFMMYATAVFFLGGIAPSPEVVLSYMPIPDYKANALSELPRLLSSYILLLSAGVASVLLKLAAHVSQFVLMFWVGWRLLGPKAEIEEVL